MDFDLGTSRVYTETKGKNQVWLKSFEKFKENTDFSCHLQRVQSDKKH